MDSLVLSIGSCCHFVQGKGELFSVVRMLPDPLAEWGGRWCREGPSPGRKHVEIFIANEYGKCACVEKG